MKGHVVFVGAGPGDPELITLRGWNALQAADVVLYDSLVDERLLQGLDAELVFVGKRCGRHSMRQERISELLVRHALRGKRVVRLKGGDPTVLGRTGEEALRLAASGIPFEIVPGVSSALAAPAFAGIPVTHRGLADSVCIVSAHRRDDEQEFSIPPYSPRTTVVLLMAGQTAQSWLGQLLVRGYPANLPLAFITAATTAKQQVLVTTVGDAARSVAKAEFGGSPTLVVIGHVVSLRDSLAWYGEDAPEAPVFLAAASERDNGATNRSAVSCVR
ncbi:MAG: uroporphyrinogen-III C-methyltransferase [Acidobacteria bacterium RIFCSPLOWO2_12_FULL_65_11]|nr:MAG: uroporphyrinogen-III C-methyltransferase [Acidobacteria bacterium RIFCSPLOWO2_02_FULL_64_15]OFW30452.1 MAG: uroporphyrinogen-III C-methyltransferase [Acidobacteria bacterium RIFCSPLOWO2_12_FULL_65_11]